MGFTKKFGPHYAIERFGVMFISLVAAMSVLVGTITGQFLESRKAVIGGRALYTGSVRMSESGAVWAVSGLYVDSARTKVLILLRCNDMSMLPTDASDYSLSVAGSDLNQSYQEIQSAPAGLFYLFGTTGYAAIYLQDLGGFPNQILALTLQADKKLTTSSSTGRADLGYIFFNPGGTYATKAAFLDKSQWTFFEMVEEVVTRRDESAARTKLNSDLQQMVQQLVLIKDYETRLANLGVQIPATPQYVADTIYAVPTEELSRTKLADCTKLSLDNYSTSRGGWLNDDGSKGYYPDRVTLFLDGKYVVPGGFDFTWQTGRVLTGYLPYLTGSTDVLTWQEYMNGKKRSSNASVPSYDSEKERFQWITGGGRTFVPLKPGDSKLSGYDENEREINTAINLLTDAWDEYYRLKTQYETIDLPALLDIEVQANNLLKSYTVNTDGVRIY